MAEHAQEGGTMRDLAHQLRRDVAPDRLEQRAGEVLKDRPLLRHAVEIPVVGRAALTALVLALIVALLLSPQFAAVILVLAFFGGWLGFAARDYNKRRPTKE